MFIVEGDYGLCVDCLHAAVNGDYTGLAAHYSEPEATRRMQEIQAGLRNLGPGLVPDFGTTMCRCTECDHRAAEESFTFKPDDDGDGGGCRTCPECSSQWLSPEGNGEVEFSRAPCDCCGSALAGSRHRFVVLGEVS